MRQNHTAFVVEHWRLQNLDRLSWFGVLRLELLRDFQQFVITDHSVATGILRDP